MCREAKVTKEEILRKREWDYDRFLDCLKSAVTLAGGHGDDTWNNMNIEIAYKKLHENGIKLKITLDDRFLYCHYPVGED